MKALALITLLLLSPLAALPAHANAPVKSPAAQLPSMIVEAGTGVVTPREILAFKQFMQTVPLPADNLHNNMVYGSGGTAVEALGRVFEISGDVELLDRMIAFADALLAGRNDPKTGFVIWTGARELVWPNSPAKPGALTGAGTENGDVVGHIAYTARLILQNRQLWQRNVPDGDRHLYGTTYLARARTYVREMDRTMDGFMLRWFVDPKTLRLHTPNSSAYEAVSREDSAGKPVPWNQQAMINNGFQRLAEAHTLLGDDPERVKKFEAVVKASVDWFFADVERCVVKGKPCYQWTYPPEEKPKRHYEDIAHGGYDLLLFCRAYQSGRYGITREMMRPFANTVTCLLLQPGNKFVAHVNGIHSGSRPPGGLAGGWIDLCEFDPALYPIFYEVNLGRVKSSPDRTANLLWARHRMQSAKEIPIN